MNRQGFLLQNLLKGLAWFALLVVVYLVVKRYVDVDYLDWLSPIYEKPLYVFSIFTVSEVVVGIIPPEVFMIWSLREGVAAIYISNVLILAALSYAAGVIGYFIGSYLNQTQFYKTLEKNFFGKYTTYLDEYGGFLIIVAALTPLPFSGICMLVGAVKYSFKKMLLFSLSRFIRFSVYAYIIWAAHYF
jgi:membrane protein DedA with SNARE-associated domain